MIFLYLPISRKLYFLREAFDFDSFFFLFFFFFHFPRFHRILSLLFFNPLFRTFFLFRLHFIFFELRSNSFHCSNVSFCRVVVSQHALNALVASVSIMYQRIFLVVLFFRPWNYDPVIINNRTCHDSRIFLNETVYDK